MNEISNVKKRREQKRQKILHGEKKKKEYPKWLFSFFTRTLFTVILTLICMIVLKSNKAWKATFYQKVYESNFSFATINQWYQNKFGSPIPFKDFFEKETEPVFHETLSYQEESKYLDGVSLTVSEHYLVPTLESGLVVFIGEKEGYGKTVIVQQMNGVDCWYGNLEEANVKLYDYVEKGSLLGESKDTNLYLVFKKEGNVLDYHDYL